MNNPVFGDGIDALLAGASIPDPHGEEPRESKYKRKKKRERAVSVEPVLPVEVAPDAGELFASEVPPPDPVDVPEEYLPRGQASLDNGLPPAGGGVEAAAPAVHVVAGGVPIEWLRVTLRALFGRPSASSAPGCLSPGVVLPWADPLQAAGNGWRDCRLELGVWRMVRDVAPDGQVSARPLLDESTVMSVTGAPFGFGGIGTQQVDCGRSVTPAEWLDVMRHPVDPEMGALVGDALMAKTRQSLESVWPWFYLLSDELEAPKCQVVKDLAVTGAQASLVPVLPVCVLTKSATLASAVRLRSRLMDRVGHAALYVGLGDRMAPAGSADVPLIVDLACDQMSVVNAWLQDVLDRTYTFDD